MWYSYDYILNAIQKIYVTYEWGSQRQNGKTGSKAFGEQRFKQLVEKGRLEQSLLS